MDSVNGCYRLWQWGIMLKCIGIMLREKRYWLCKVIARWKMGFRGIQQRCKDYNNWRG